MKTQIIHLQKSDDYISVRDRMSWSQARRILLIWPNEAHVLDRRLDLVLVSRYAVELGAELAFVTHNGEVHLYAHKLGISVFRDEQLAEAQSWKVVLRGKIGSPPGLIHLKRIPGERWNNP